MAIKKFDIKILWPYQSSCLFKMPKIHNFVNSVITFQATFMSYFLKVNCMFAQLEAIINIHFKNALKCSTKVKSHFFHNISYICRAKSIFYMEKVRRMIRDIEEEKKGKSFSLKKKLCSIYPKKICFFMLTCPSISLTLTPGVMREKHEKLVSFTIYKLSSFQHGTTLDVCWGYWLAQVPLTSTHKHIWNVISVFFLSPKHRKKSRHLNIFLCSFLSYNVYVLCKQTYSCSYGASLHFAHIFYSNDTLGMRKLFRLRLYLNVLC